MIQPPDGSVPVIDGESSNAKEWAEAINACVAKLGGDEDAVLRYSEKKTMGKSQVG